MVLLAECNNDVNETTSRLIDSECSQLLLHAVYVFAVSA